MKQTQDILLVLGMHRSGTSLVTHILSRAGYFLGEEHDLMKGTDANRDGYFERWSVVKTNELILNLCGGRWDLPPEERDILRIRIDPRIEYLLKTYEGHEKALIKDPRMCITFPAWRRFLGKTLRIVLVTRDPMAVAASLQKRDGFTVQKGLALCRVYSQRALHYAGSYPTHSIQYEDLLSEKRHDVLKGLSAFTGITADLEGIAARVVDSTLNHYNDHHASEHQRRKSMRNGLISSGREMGHGTFCEDISSSVQSPTDQTAASGEGIQKTLRASIIIPVFNNLEYTKRCLEAIVRHTPGEWYEVILVDNGSSDGTKEYFRCLEGDLKVITNDHNLGFAKACNQGAATSSTDYLLFLNNDTEPQDGWLEPLVSVLDGNSSVAAAGSKLLYPDRSIQHAGVVIAEDRKRNDPLLAKHVCVGKPENYDAASEMKTYQALTAACMMVRKTAFEKVGGFDEGYWNGYEDIDLCFRLQEHGLKIVYQPESVVIHHESRSGKERFSKVNENIARLHRKWIGKVTPDIVIREDGTIEQTEAPFVRRYVTPDQVHAPQPGKASHRKKSLVSIVILTFNELQYTRECVKSIRQHTPEPHEIIFVDNGSTDGTVEWLRAIVRDNTHYKLVENETNLGFSKGCNQGIDGSSGEYILLLNNDVVVTENWLSGMLECLNSSPDIGIVGPMTNSISGPQRIDDIGYASVSQLDGYARIFREQHRHRRIPLRRIVGFCMLFRRELSENIGLLDETFGTGNFEDDDYCLRAALAGYRNTIAGDVFVHHYGSRSFIGNSINYRLSMSGNRKTYKAKWGAVNASSALGKHLLAIQALEKASELHQRDQAEKAIAILIDVIKHAPDDTRIYTTIVHMLLESKQYEEALNVIDRMPPDETDPQRLCLAGYCKEGLASYDEAADLARRAHTLSPLSAPALNLQGVIAFRKEDRPSAEACFRKAIEADPGYGEPYTNLGVLIWSAGDHEAGLDLLEKGFVLAPLSHDAVSLFHSSALSVEAFSRAEKAYREAYSLYPQFRRVCFLLIDICLRQGKYDEAMRLTQEAIITFGVDDGILAAALGIRERIGQKEIPPLKNKEEALSVCMIVRNEEAHLPRCLLSIADLADEIIAVDTGSTDKTKDIAMAFGAKVFDFPWTGDFSAARNVSLEKASGGWILILDADEVISPKDHASLKKLVHETAHVPAAYAVTTRNYIKAMNITGWTANEGQYPDEEAGSGWNPSTKTRLFSNGFGIRFENRVHELVEASLARLNVTPQPCDIPVHHYGKLKEEKVMAKGEDYFLLGREKLRETNDAQALFELAVQAGELDRFTDAIELWEQYLRLPDQPPELVLRAYINIGHAFVQTGRYDEAFAASRKALELAPDSPGAVMNYSLSELWRGDLQKAVPFLENLLEAIPDYPPATGMLAVAALLSGQTDSARSLFEQLKGKGFLCEPYLRNHAQKLIEANRVDCAISMIETAVAGGLGTMKLNTLIEECRERSVD